MTSTSSPSEKMASFSFGFWPRESHQSIASSPPSIGSLESMRMPVQEAIQSGACCRKCVVP